MNNHRNDLNDLYCWKCSAPMTTTKAPTVLIGGFTCHICYPCCNDWVAHMQGNSLVLRASEIVVTVKQIGNKTICDGVDRAAELKELLAEEQQILAQLFGVAKEWVSTKPAAADAA